MIEKKIYTFILKHYLIVLERLRYKLIIDEKYNLIQKPIDSQNRTVELAYIKINKYAKILSPFNIDDILKLGYFSFEITNYSYLCAIHDLGINIYKRDSYSAHEFICSINNLEIILTNFADHICQIKTPYYRIPLRLFSYYKNICQKKKPMKTIHFPNEKKEVEAHDIFAYKATYTDVEWSFEMVEEYKNIINWKLLIEYSNLKWSEDLILEYIQFIPFMHAGETFCDKFNEFVTIQDFSKISLLSNSFIDDNKEHIDFTCLLKTGTFKWTSYDLLYFYNWAKEVKIPYSNSFKNERAGTQIQGLFFYNLAMNPNFEWDSDLLIAAINLENTAWDNFIDCEKDRRADILNKIKLIPKYKELIKDKIYTIDFLKKIEFGEEILDESHKEFTIENLIKYSHEWNKIICEKHDHCIIRRPDTNYHWHELKTKWDYFINNEKVLLTYELCLFLKKTSIILGGSYCTLDDTDYIEKDFRYQKINGLMAFCKHHIVNVVELEKICSNQELLDFFFIEEYKNNDVIDYLIEKFFKDYHIEDFLVLLKDLKLI